MEITQPLLPEISLKIATGPKKGPNYPTAALQKGWVLVCRGQELAEEGLGFGVPVLKRGLQTIFASDVRFSFHPQDPAGIVAAWYTMNLEEKIASPGVQPIASNWIYTVKNFLAALIRNAPPLRGLLTGLSNATRQVFSWTTRYEESQFTAVLKVSYAFNRPPGCIQVEVDTTGLAKDGVTEIILMNEQGARYFDCYRDSSGVTLQGNEIGCWDEVTASWGCFASRSQKLAFSLARLDGAKLYRGRELIGSRLAWSGFGYSFPPTISRASFQVQVTREA